ncbi:hypothetical protein [Corallococcus sp. 4LFB]|uniref:hypothetical protein n=1 Tax=Corallococcus sp. 4LFB TaxID=3383249 RepID=UPI0039769FFE
MDPRAATLLSHVRASAENRPGVYRFFGPAGELLYVGKSVRVRTRLLSYFRADEGEKAWEIVAQAHQVEWEYTASEFAALLHEFRLIKSHRPLYNVEHKRDRSHCFLQLTREAVPRLRVVGQPGGGGSAEYFGPFHGRHTMADVVRAVNDLLELRDCPSETPMRLADQLPLFPMKDDPRCMRGQTARCLSPCASGCTTAEYLAQVALARAFLNGESDRPLVILRERMAMAARRSSSSTRRSCATARSGWRTCRRGSSSWGARCGGCRWSTRCAGTAARTARTCSGGDGSARRSPRPGHWRSTRRWTRGCGTSSPCRSRRRWASARRRPRS